MIKNVGVVGLGIMGLPMARNAAAKGFSVHATTRSAARRRAASDLGLNVHETPAEVAAASDAIIVIVTGPDDVRSVLNGPAGVLAQPLKGKIVIQMSTIDEPSTQEFQKNVTSSGGRFLDCPVTGSKKQVEAGELILLASGEQALVEECRALLLSMGKAIVYAGPAGKGTALKLCMNLIVAQMTTALAEAVALARSQNLAPERIFDVIGHSPALNCGYYAIKKKAFLENDFSPAFSLNNMLKDVRFMTQAAQRTGQPLPVTSAVQKVMEETAEAGLGESDLSAVARILEKSRAERS